MPKASSAKNKAPRATGKPSTKSPAKASGQKPAAESIDASAWPASTTWTGQKINKTKAKELYRLKDEELDGLRYDRILTAYQPMLLYQEGAVEQVAWRKHGGPEAFYKSLDKLKARHSKMQDKPGARQKPFAAPKAYFESRGLQGHEGATVHLSLEQEREKQWTSTPELRLLKARFTPWVWDSVIKSLCRWERRIEPLTHEDILKMALRIIYPERPKEMLPSSSSVNRVREILARAPVSGEGYEEVEGITVSDDQDGVYHRWSDYYTDELYTALMDVVYEHGTGEEGWMAIRWEVYDKHASCISGLDLGGEGRSSGWYDDAARWLRGKPAQGEHQTKLRAEYKFLLPETDEWGVLVC